MSLMEERRPQVYAPMVWRSFAKINLYLDVLRKRRDGYHNIETIFQTVNLYDELTFVNDNHLSMTCSGAGLDTGRSNLVYRAAALLQEETGCMRGARIHLEKRIPIAAGLAGGSGNAAATLSALNKLWDLRLPLGRLTRLARVLGSDVSYCLYGGTMAGTQRGEELSALPPIQNVWFVLAHPSAAMSAVSAYNHALLETFANRLSRENAHSEKQSEPSQREIFLSSFNRMEKPVFAEHKTLFDIKEILLKAGCDAVAMSGSGPTLFGVCHSQRDALKVAELLKLERPDCAASVVSPADNGIEWLR